MKLFITCFCLLIISALHAQVYGPSGPMREKTFACRLITTDDFAKMNMIFDSIAVKKSGYHTATITVMDSTYSQNLSQKGKKAGSIYAENISLAFSPNGKIQKEHYSYKNHDRNSSSDFQWYYVNNQNVIITINEQDPFLNQLQLEHHATMYSYNATGHLTGFRYWEVKKEFSYPADTNARLDYFVYQETYDQKGAFSGANLIAYFNDTLRIIDSEKVISVEHINNTTNYVLMKSDSSKSTITETVDSLNHPLSKIVSIKDDTLSVEHWKYDKNENLIYYVNIRPTHTAHPVILNEYIIDRDEKGLPTKIVYHGNPDSITFYIKWE